MAKRFSKEKMQYIELLSQSYPGIPQASAEVINLQAILNLPKGTEHFLSDIHGEYAPFLHVLHNASGVIKDYIEELFPNMSASEKQKLATLIYYPEQRMERVALHTKHPQAYYQETLFQLILVLKRVSSKYTRSRVRKALPPYHAYVIEELLHEGLDSRHKDEYYQQIIDSIIRLDRAPAFITAICAVIHRLAIDRLHIIGDIYDRGPHADQILDLLLGYHHVDIQWGNHDISWMGAAFGCEALVCNVLRMSAKYNSLRTIEDGYGINLVPLAAFALQAYGDTFCDAFLPDAGTRRDTGEGELRLIARMHLAITIMQLKCEAAVIRRNPGFAMENRLFLDGIDGPGRSVNIHGVPSSLTCDAFPTLSSEDPIALTPEEQSVLQKLVDAFLGSEKLQRHARFLLNKGSIYLVCNGNLLYHGCIPMTQGGALRDVSILGRPLKGKALLDGIEAIVREGCFAPYGSAACRKGLDMMWYLWCGPDSPLFGKDKLALFERSFLSDESQWKERMDPYYGWRDCPETCETILADFGLDPKQGHIINGHVPVKVSRGESPIKAGGRLLVIDGGFARAYQPVTGLAGYTLIFNSKGLILAAHEPYDAEDPSALTERGMLSHTEPVALSPRRIKVDDTDAGHALRRKIDDLMDLIACYRRGWIREQGML